MCSGLFACLLLWQPQRMPGVEAAQDKTILRLQKTRTWLDDICCRTVFPSLSALQV